MSQFKKELMSGSHLDAHGTGTQGPVQFLDIYAYEFWGARRNLLVVTGSVGSLILAGIAYQTLFLGQ